MPESSGREWKPMSERRRKTEPTVAPLRDGTPAARRRLELLAARGEGPGGVEADVARMHFINDILDAGREVYGDDFLAQLNAKLGTEGDRYLKRIDDLLDLARLEEGKVRLRVKELDIIS